MTNNYWNNSLQCLERVSCMVSSLSELWSTDEIRKHMISMKACKFKDFRMFSSEKTIKYYYWIDTNSLKLLIIIDNRFLDVFQLLVQYGQTWRKTFYNFKLFVKFW